MLIEKMASAWVVAHAEVERLHAVMDTLSDPDTRMALDEAVGAEVTRMAEIEDGLRAAPAASASAIADKIAIALANASEIAEGGEGIDRNWRLVESALHDLRGIAPAQLSA